MTDSSGPQAAAEPTPRVGLVFVSHSVQIAEGLVALARQMAPNPVLVAAGGRDDDGIGTSFDKIAAGIAEADGGAEGGGVVMLCDLGSAILTAETAMDFLDDPARERVRLADAPLVEGGVAAAVAAEVGGDLDAVVRAAESAREATSAAPEAVAEKSPPAEGGGGAVVRIVTLRNRDGLHARPAADFVKLASTFDAEVTVNGKDAHSLLGIMSLGLTRGMSVEISGPDERSRAAVDALAELIESGFGEP